MSKPHFNSKSVAQLSRYFNRSQFTAASLSLMNELPNPDPILRKAGKTADIYEEIVRDSHVIGEIRSLRAGMFAFNAELVPGGEDEQSLKSYELIKSFFAKRPANHTQWADIDWHSYSAMLHGFCVIHLGAYEQVDGYWLPAFVESWPQSRFSFTNDHELLIKTKEYPRGEQTDASRWACVRHMPTANNPYGTAVLSSCFWPWIFKHGGFKFFVQLTERFGIPFPVGKYPIGAQDKDINDLLE